MLQLNYNNQVDFFEETHKYINNKSGKILSGVTAIVNKLFPLKYANIPAHILAKAAEYGTLIHSKCQTQDMFNSDPDCVEIENYIKLKEENSLIPVENEYLVSDNEFIATMIDNIYTTPEGLCILGDIKTTSSLDIEALSWQLSIGAYLFELQNPKIKIDRLIGVWLRHDKKKLEPVTRIDNEIVKSLIDAFLNDTEFINPLKMELSERPEIAQLEQLENTIIGLKDEIAYYEEQKANIMSVIESEMEKNNIKKWETDRLSFTRVLPSQSVSFDSKKFKADNPELAAQYEKTTNKKGYLKVTIK